MALTDICSKCGKDGMNCTCTQFFPNIPMNLVVFDRTVLINDKPFAIFTVEELRAIYRNLEKQYIPYDDLEAHEAIRKIQKIIEGK